MSVKGSTKTTKFPVDVFTKYSKKFYREDIQGLRALSALTIMVYHIWLHKVSGGVDVFFVISGFLVTASLLRGVAAKGSIQPLRFITRIWRRVLPSAYVVLIGTLLLSFLFVSIPLWKYGINEFVASAAHIENLELIRMGTDYLDREAPPSQFQQFWALSIQMQFYACLLIGMWVLVYGAKRLKATWPLFFGISLAAVLSFTFSIVYTHFNAAEAYFHPAARLWEFLAGTIIALVYPFVHRVTNRLAARFWSILASLALVGFLSIGLLVDEQANYPGAVALLPVSCAVIILLAGKLAPADSFVNRLLSSRFLTYLGSFSFTIYLWHWPVLVFAQYYLATTELSLGAGLCVVGVSVLLAAITKHLVEDPMMRRPQGNVWVVFAKQAGLMLVVVTVGILIRQGLIVLAGNYLPIVEDTQRIEEATIQQATNLPVSYLVSVDYDRPDGISCLSEDCKGGALNGEYKVVLVGDSHAAQWFDVFDRFGMREGFLVETRLGESDISSVIDETQPDVLVTVSTSTSDDPHSDDESVRDLAYDLIRETPEDIQVVGIRDNPRFGFYQNACVADNPEHLDLCSLDQSSVYAGTNPVTAIADTGENFHSVDFSGVFCAEGVCPPIIDDVLVYYDKHHFSKSYLVGVSDSVMTELSHQAPGVFTRE